MSSHIPKNFTKISISRYVPEFFAQDLNNFWMPQLAPTPELLNVGKSNSDKTEYIKRYKEEVLGVLDPNEVARDIGHNGVIMCYEKVGDFCHRNLVADWLRYYGYDVSEFKREAA